MNENHTPNIVASASNDLKAPLQTASRVKRIASASRGSSGIDSADTVALRARSRREATSVVRIGNHLSRARSTESSHRLRENRKQPAVVLNTTGTEDRRSAADKERCSSGVIYVDQIDTPDSAIVTDCNTIEHKSFENWYRRSFDDEGGASGAALTATLLAEALAQSAEECNPKVWLSWKTRSNAVHICTGGRDHSFTNSPLTVSDVGVAIAGAQATTKWIDQWMVGGEEEEEEENQVNKKLETQNSPVKSTALSSLVTVHPDTSSAIVQANTHCRLPPLPTPTKATAIAGAKATTKWIDSWAEINCTSTALEATAGSNYDLL